MNTRELDYELPQELIAQHPTEKRDQSRLLVYYRATGEVSHRVFRDLPEGLPAGTFGDLEQQEVLLAKTADRSVLGCMNDMAFRCEHVIAGAGGLARTDLAELNRSLRRNINSARGYCPPIELAARRLAV